MKTTLETLDRLQLIFDDMAYSTKELLQLNEDSIRACDKFLEYLNGKVGEENA
ncbi:hypothetical protein ACSU64_05605 [Bacillaceae bacterium C204]|uniref:hypothetical protein n=1 Tax=Neobacillus sp. 204 TaxID=3383351 RepID=UPI00397B71C6